MSGMGKPWLSLFRGSDTPSVLDTSGEKYAYDMAV